MRQQPAIILFDRYVLNIVLCFQLERNGNRYCADLHSPHGFLALKRDKCGAPIVVRQRFHSVFAPSDFGHELHRNWLLPNTKLRPNPNRSSPMSYCVSAREQVASRIYASESPPRANSGLREIKLNNLETRTGVSDSRVKTIFWKKKKNILFRILL